MKYYLLMNKEDDYGNCRCGVYYGKENDIKKHVYFYKEIPKTHYEILKKYFENINEMDCEEFCHKKEYLNEYYG